MSRWTKAMDVHSTPLSCQVAPEGGWTAASGYTNLIGGVLQGDTGFDVYEVASGKVIQQTPLTEYGSVQLLFQCSYTRRK